MFFSYLFPLLLSFLVTLSLIYLLRPLATKLKLVDIPDHRKNHIGAVPLVGGLSVYGGVVVVCLLFIPLDLYSLVWLLASFIVVAMGVIDDAITLSSHLRLLIQFIIAIVICFGSGLSFENIGSWIGTGDIHLGGFSYIVTLFCIVGSINAFNMMDGIDGLAGAMASISLAGFSLLFLLNGDVYGYLLATVFIASVIPYLYSNLKKSPKKGKIFMGDAGSMLIGLTVAWLALYGTQTESASFKPITVLWLIAIPVMDMVAVMLSRIRRGDSLFKPDKEHLHHILMSKGFSPRKSLFLISLSSFLFALLGVFGHLLLIPDVVMLGGFIFLLSLYLYLMKGKFYTYTTESYHG